ncbi:MAG: signal peptidase II [Anaerolineae bacterium]|nr:signal peptidase II [Anaerolineae bacterium]
MKTMTRNRLLLLGGAATVLILDQLSKYWVLQNLPEYTPTDFIPWLKPILSFTYITNTGVAFGLFPQLGGIFTVVSAVVVVLVFLFQSSFKDAHTWVHLALGTVTGGALGNLIDRLLRGFVIDFIDVNFWPFHAWPVFNVADSAILIGVTVLLLDSLLFDLETHRQKSNGATEETLNAEDSCANV